MSDWIHRSWRLHWRFWKYLRFQPTISGIIDFKISRILHFPNKFQFHEFQGKIIILYEIYFTNFYLFLGWTKMHLRHRTYVWLPRRKFTSGRRRYWGRGTYNFNIRFRFIEINYFFREIKFNFFFHRISWPEFPEYLYQLVEMKIHIWRDKNYL